MPFILESVPCIANNPNPTKAQLAIVAQQSSQWPLLEVHSGAVFCGGCSVHYSSLNRSCSQSR
ncbi:hypothetical protein TSUD_268000 [Trifolium subterraneum]|uniref:Uncharacterized protein n=1 Tax=Trifolium subterraneum TaxID=3900 RepID=A0A2Z6P7N0_TRISU|nr:hypothetical protein TSUD_268000 [Trifolium subterraneum]